MQTGDIVETIIESLAYGGDGVGRAGEMVIFVPFSAPGDRLLVRVTEVKKNYLRGRIEQIRESSPSRVHPLCQDFGLCGGCHYQHIIYQRQLHWKERQVKDALQRIGRLDEPPVAAVIPSPQTYGYRGKIEVHASEDTAGRFRVGLHAGGTNRLIEIDRCEIAHETINDALKSLRRRLEAGKISFLPSRLAIWSGDKNEGRVCLDQKIRIERAVKGHILSVGAGGFFQANLTMTDVLIDQVLDLCALEGGETVVDCYSGVGLFSFFLAHQAKQIYLIERDAAALAWARVNLARAEGERAVYLAGDTGGLLRDVLIREGIRPEVMVLDPPRPGLAREVIAGIGTLKPARLVYVSCNPATLARDAAHLTAYGYRLATVRPLDMFPQTGHLEAVSLLVRT